eukprot:Em0021g682a
MPPKKKKGGAVSRKKGSKDAAQATLDKDSLIRICRNFLKAYTQRCQTVRSAPSPRVTRDAKTLLEEDKALEKFILEPCLSVPAAASTDQKDTPPPSKQLAKPAASYPMAVPVGVPMSANSRIASATEGGATGRRYPILVQTLVEAWCNANYKFMRALHVWHLELPDEEIVSLALFMESPLGTNLVHLEIINGNISPWGFSRLAKSLKTCHLTNLHLDYNRELYLDNNLLECEGATELFKLIAAFCENPTFPKPRLAKLCMQNNAIDENGKLVSLGPEVCMQLVKSRLSKRPVGNKNICWSGVTSKATANLDLGRDISVPITLHKRITEFIVVGKNHIAPMLASNGMVAQGIQGKAWTKVATEALGQVHAQPPF